jgi:succinoglycan biosynthesis transport protein ExoP
MYELNPQHSKAQRDPRPGVPVRFSPGWMSQVVEPEPWNQYPNGNPADASGGLLDYWEKIRAHKLALTIAALAGLTCGFLWWKSETPVYRGRASIEVFQKTGAEVPVDVMPTDAFVRTQMKIIESESLLERAAKRLNLSAQDMQPARPGWLEQVSHRMSGRQTGPQTPKDWSGVLSSGMKVQSPDGTRLVEITLDSPSPRLCTLALGGIVAEYVATTAGSRANMTQETSAWLVEQIAGMRRNLESSENALLKFAANRHLVLLGEKDSLAEETLRQLHAELAKAEADKVIKQSAQETATSRPSSTLPETLDNGPLKDYEVKLTELRRQFAEVSHAYTPEYYKYQRLQAQIQELEQAIERERTNVVKRIQNEYESADRRRRLLEDQYTSQVAAVGRQSLDLAQYNLLKRDVDTNRQVYETTLQRLREYGIQSALHANGVRVIDEPQTSNSPHWPKLKWTLALGLLAGVLIGFTGVLITDGGSATIQMPGQAGALLGAPELGAIPQSATPAYTRLMRRNVPQLDRWSDSSFPADSFRSTLASILFARNEGRPSQILVVTSALPREGKTVSTSNLGIALAEARQRVLIIDADTRKPHVHDMFGIENTRGLADLLAGTEGLEPESCIVKTSQDTLDVLPAGQPDGQGWVQVLYSPHWTKLLHKLRQEYDTILIDSPPLLHVPDARILGKLADGMVFVIRANQTHRDAVLLARQKLVQDGIVLLGVILNGWLPTSSGYGSYGYAPGAYRPSSK